MKNILLLCTSNSCRSQMAEAFAKVMPNDRYSIFSAGIEKQAEAIFERLKSDLPAKAPIGKLKTAINYTMINECQRVGIAPSRLADACVSRVTF